jgi:16S rRNA U516 pseudouridylate synthase RsuA-like enzyme
MTAAVGFPTLRLVRVRIGQISLNDMKSGEVRSIRCTGIIVEFLFLKDTTIT